MALFVQKYGGTSVGSIERIQRVADRIIHTIQQGHRVVVVVSAMAGETNRLTELALQITDTPSAREHDVLVTAGEQVSIALLSIALISRGYSAVSMLADQAGIKAAGHFGNARIESINTQVIEEHLQHNRIVIVAGFQGRDIEQNLISLGRGGTDTTAVAVAAALEADECQIFTDVDGVYTTDPRLVKCAQKLSEVTFEEMFELASCGAKVLHRRSVELAGKYHVPLRVLSSFSPTNSDIQQSGTLITSSVTRHTELDQRVSKQKVAMENKKITGITASENETMIAFDLPAVPQTEVFDLLSVLTEQDIELDMLSHEASFTHESTVAAIRFVIKTKDLPTALSLLQQYTEKNKLFSGQVMQVSDSVAKISVVGVGMRSHAGVITAVLKRLARQQIPVLLASATEIKVSVIIDKRYMELAVNALHEEFALNAEQSIKL